MLQCMGQVERAAVQAQFFKRACEQLARRAHQRATTQVFRIAGLLFPYPKVSPAEEAITVVPCSLGEDLELAAEIFASHAQCK